MLASLRTLPAFFLRPAHVFRGYARSSLTPDVLAGLTVAAVLLPQGVAMALLAGLPPQMGLYAGILAAIVAALWGSSNHLQSGPTNSASILVSSTLLPIAAPGTSAFVSAAGLLAVMSGFFRLGMGLARLGLLVNFVSDSVVVGFTAGAGALIIVGELRHLLGLSFSSSPDLVSTLGNLAVHLPEAHFLSLALGLGALVLIAALRRLSPKAPGVMVGLVVASGITAAFGLSQQGVVVLGQLPRSLPPLADLPLFDLKLVGQLSSGALAVSAIGLVEAATIARSIAGKSGQRLDTNQEFVGQGLANIACGFFSGFPCSGSFNRSVLNFTAGARTPLASVFSGLFVFVGLLTLAPLAAYLPRTALAGVLILAGYGMIDGKEMARVWRGARGEALIMVVTLLATLLLPLQFAVLTGILMSLAYYILKTSTPRVRPVVPDDAFAHFVYDPQKPMCPQLAIFDILGDLYFGAVSHVENTLHQHQARHPGQKFLLLRMYGVHLCDLSGIHMLESIVRVYREQGGDVFMVRVHKPVLQLMQQTGFLDYLGADHFLSEDDAVEHLFYRVLDPAICVYESNVRVFKECQNLPRPDYSIEIPLYAEAPGARVPDVSPQQLWGQLRGASPPLVIDVREPREFQRGHIPQALLLPLSRLLAETPDLPRDRPLVCVCRSGRRSTRAASLLRHQGHDQIAVLRGGMLAWETAGLLEAIGEV